MKTLYAKKLESGMGLGIFTPSMPAHVLFPEKYEHGLRVAESMGFEVIEGNVTKSRVSQGYRTAPPASWSNHFRDAKTDAWKSIPRVMTPNPGWRCLRPGTAEGRLITANLSTLCANAGTPAFPDLDGKLLLIETMAGTAATEERLLRQLEQMGVFSVIKGLIVGKPEDYRTSGEPFTHDELILEVVGGGSGRGGLGAGARGAGRGGVSAGARDFPIITNFDCSHTNPMLTLAEDCLVSVSTSYDYQTSVRVLEPMVAE